jgi:two-component system, cell cycle response regulator DivK
VGKTARKDLALIIDDNEVNRTLLQYVLEAGGFEVRMAGNAAEALQVLATVRPQVVLMDLQLPGTSGLELTQRMKADPHTHDIVIIAVTSYAMKGDEQKARAAGCDGYLTKPIDVKTFVEDVRDLIEAGPRAADPPD